MDSDKHQYHYAIHSMEGISIYAGFKKKFPVLHSSVSKTTTSRNIHGVVIILTKKTSNLSQSILRKSYEIHMKY